MIGRRILIVEDEYLVAEDLRRWLLGRGAEVVGPAPRLARAQAVIASQALDAALLDVNLAGEMVFPAAEALLARGIPFVFMSGFDRSIIPQQFADVQVLEKPILFDVLLEALTALLGH